MGRTVLILEDEAIIAIDLAQTFEDWGWEVIGPAGRVDRAEALCDDRLPGLAVLDINVGKATSYDLARRLRDGRTRVVFLSGRDGLTIPEDLSDCAALSKPVNLAELRRLVEGEPAAADARRLDPDQ